MTPSTPQLITVTVYDNDRYNTPNPPYNLAQYIEWLGHKLNEIPVEYRDSAETHIDGETEYDSGVLVYKIMYKRPETPQEIATREGDANRRADRQRQQDLATLAALQAKYGAQVP